MNRAIPMVLAVLGLVIAGPVWGASISFETEAASYLLSTGTDGGACARIDNGMQCVDGKNRASVIAASGCGEKQGRASCVLAGRRSESPVPPGTNTLECEGGTRYELSDGGNGRCTANDGLSMRCGEPSKKPFAEASCASGCGDTSGIAACRIG